MNTPYLVKLRHLRVRDLHPGLSHPSGCTVTMILCLTIVIWRIIPFCLTFIIGKGYMNNMNPQFFGDRHDLFKYDLIFTIMEWMRYDLSSFTFIPMLTKNRPQKTNDVAGADNHLLREVFNTLFGDGAARGYFEGIRHYFISGGFRINIFNEPFSHSHRKEYFDSVRAQVPANSLVFLDPDTGLKEKNETEKHLRYSELRDLYNGMDASSILMVYQHHNRYRTKTQNFPEFIADNVEQNIGERPVYIDNNSIMFLFLAKNTQLQEKLEGILNDYKKKYPGSFNTYIPTPAKK
jgi:hypothetical protein